MGCWACSRSPQNALRPGEFRKSFMKTSPEPWVDSAECPGVVVLGAFGNEWQRQDRSLCIHPCLFPPSGSSQPVPCWWMSPFMSSAVLFAHSYLYPISFSLWSPSPEPPPHWPPHSSRSCVEVPCVSSPGLEPWEVRAPWTFSLLSDEHRE